MSESSLPLELEDAEAVLRGGLPRTYELRLVEDEGRILLELAWLEGEQRRTCCPLLPPEEVRQLIADLLAMLRRVGG